MRNDLLGLQGFLSLADHGTFQQASAHLGISQTALSHRIKKFEAELGIELFARTTRKVSLTPAGNRLVPQARRILADLEATLRQVRSETSPANRLAIGCIPTVAVRLLSRAIAQFNAAQPQVAVKVIDASATHLLDLIGAGTTIEFAVTVLRAYRSDLEFHPLLKEEFVVLCLSEDPLARRDEITLAELDQHRLIRNSVAAEALGTRATAIRWDFEAENVNTAVSMVEAGLGITIIPRLGARSDTDTHLATLRLRAPTVARNLGILRRGDSPLSPAGAQFVKLLAGVMKSAQMAHKAVARV